MTLECTLMVALLLFSMGLYAVLARRNLIAILIGVELMLNAANVNFLAFAYFRPSEPAVARSTESKASARTRNTPATSSCCSGSGTPSCKARPSRAAAR